MSEQSQQAQAGDVPARALESVRTVLAHMGLEATATVHEEPEQVVVDVAGDEAGLVIGKKGATLDAIQYLVNKMLEGRLGGEGGDATTPFRRVVVDAQGYRARRSEALVDLAHRLADRARKTRQVIAMEPMSPHDRRIVHVALADEPGVTTRSEGEGTLRHLTIVPQPGGPAGEPPKP